MENTKEVLFKYKKLLSVMKSKRIKKSDLADLLGITNSAISHRFYGITQWRIDEIYKVLNYIGVSLNEVNFYFPE